jgi:hypothetical protein
MKSGQKTDNSGAAIVCVHVALQGLPIMLAIRSTPQVPEDSGWQFVCRSEADEVEETAQVWSLNEVLKNEPTLLQFLEMPIGTRITRDDIKSPWIVASTS